MLPFVSRMQTAVGLIALFSRSGPSPQTDDPCTTDMPDADAAMLHVGTGIPGGIGKSARRDSKKAARVRLYLHWCETGYRDTTLMWYTGTKTL